MQKRIFAQGEFDCPDFLDMVEQLLTGRLCDQPTQNFYIVKVDNWFNFKWLNFLGTVGKTFKIAVWTGNLRIPPFAPDRILQSRRFRYSDEDHEYESDSEPVIHREWGDPQELWKRHIAPLAEESGLFAWVSGNTKVNGRGWLMVYDISGEQQDSWYCGFVKSGTGWKLDRCRGTSPTVVNFYSQRGEGSQLSFRYRWRRVRHFRRPSGS